MSYVTRWCEKTVKVDKVAEGLRTVGSMVVQIEQCEDGDVLVILEFELV